MSAALARLRKRAAELEQKKQFDRALEVYVQILDEGGKDLGDEDVPLFNRVGDMLMRKGSVTEALGYYERAVDMYAERGYLNNAIALCSKILRQSPGRAAVYYKLARISAKKGFKSDARKNFLEYADRMQKLGMADEAFRALKEFASLYPDQDDVRLVLAELLSKENRKGEAIEQLQSLYEKLQSEGRAAEARATVDRMRAIDPSVTPRAGTETQPQPPADLVFLDLSEAEGASRPTPSVPRPLPPVKPSMPTPVPALTGLSITFFPEDEPARPEGFETTSVQPQQVEEAPAHATSEGLDFVERGSDLLEEIVGEERPPEQPRELDMIEEPPSSPDPFELVDLSDAPQPGEDVQESDVETIAESAPSEVVELEFPEPQTDLADVIDHATPLSGAAFAGIELEDMPHPAPSRSHDLALPGELPVTPEDLEAVAGPSPASAAAVDDARTAAEEAADIVADFAAREAAQVIVAAIPSTPATLVDESPAPPPDESGHKALDMIGQEPAADANASLPDDFLANPPSFGQSSTSEDHAFPPLFGLAESSVTPEDNAAASEHAMKPEEIEEALEPVVPQQYVPTPARGTISIGTAEGHLRRRLELDPENYDLRRQLGEVLLDTGDRDGGLQELELAMVGFELRGEMERAQKVVDEILRVQPASVAHHQKRVEYAVRSRDKGRLTNSYLELADALFRTGAADSAVAVYGRVLELDASNERAEFALSTLAPAELARLRGVPARPERWSDELHAIANEQATRQADVEEPAVEAPEAVVAPEEVVASAAVPADDAPIDGLELPNPDWGEGVPTPQSSKVEEPAELAPSSDRAETSAASEWEGLVAEEEPSREAADVAHAETETVHAFAEAPVEELVDEILDEPAAPPPPRAPTPRASTPVAPTRVPTPRAATPIAPPRVPTPRIATPIAPRMPTPMAPPRMPTPRSATPPTVARITPRPEIPISSDADFVDLGEWLRDTEPARSTRMQVESPKPTGDEQADFEELLRRFKRGVAENVEEEDYEAHYDLGVAYKEMGLIDEAIAQFQKALRGPTNRVRTYEALGQCFVEKQQYPIAAALLQRATEVPGSDDQQLVGVLYLLGFATEHLGRPADALAYYLRVFAVDIEFRDVAARVAAMGNQAK